ncbi:hypothetical protein A0H81_14688 [Grifola frondosa]|uniref:Uncharacterized protein n=1 Tax=Grifola frondosa TaxID=5627 RepID=A0A1C7LR83_GRIFR|nr:hypothetical protein A0H81_14688 [Grifola frondosa]
MVEPSELAQQIPPRSPSRMGFHRPLLIRSDCQLNLEFKTCSDSWSDTSDEDEHSLCSSALYHHHSRHAPDYENSDDSSGTDDEDEDPRLDQRAAERIEAWRLRSASTSLSAPASSLESNTAAQLPMIPPSARTLDNGFSRRAFTQLKEFWNMRKAHWEQWRLHLEATEASDAAYDGIESPASYPSGQRSPRVASNDPTAAIYPRLGDIAKLPNVHSAHIDRAFCDLPTYTIHKILFLHDMLHREQKVSPHTTIFCAAGDSGTLACAPDQLCSSDSSCGDKTLVEDEPRALQGKCDIACGDCLTCAKEYEVNCEGRSTGAQAALEESARDAEISQRRSLLGVRIERPVRPKFFIPDDEEYIW